MARSTFQLHYGYLRDFQATHQWRQSIPLWETLAAYGENQGKAVSGDCSLSWKLHSCALFMQSIMKEGQQTAFK